MDSHLPPDKLPSETDNNYLESVKSSITHIKNDDRKENNEKYLKSYALELDNISKIFNKSAYGGDLRFQIGRELATPGVVSMLCDIAVDVLNLDKKDENKAMDGVNLSVLNASLRILWNFSDGNQADTPIICDHPEFLKRTAKYLTDINDDSLLQRVKYPLLSIIHNVAMFDSNISKIRSFDYVRILTPYLNHSREKLRLIAIATMADIVNEKESEILQKGRDVLTFLKGLLQVGVKQENRMYPVLNFPVWELTRMVRTVAKNDANKNALVNLGFLPLLVEIAKSEDNREQREAIGALRTLSFDEKIRKKITSDDTFGVISTFVELLDNKDPDVAKSSRGALWNMREELMKHDKYKDIEIVKQFAALQVQKQEEIETQCKKGHIMISYQWSHQQMLLNVRDHLRSSGYRVWMDVDDMSGSTLDAMARAVEDAEVVLICYSREYKFSDNCHAEAEYAFEKRKPLIPLRMEHKYKADGWLGMIIGAKKYYDFSGKYTFDLIADDLVKELRSKYSDHQEIVPQKAKEVYSQPVVLSSTTEICSSMDAKSWTEMEVGKWLDKHELDKSQFGHLRGVEIVYLKFLLEKVPHYFNKALIKDLKIKDLFTKAKFTLAVADTRI